MPVWLRYISVIIFTVMVAIFGTTTEDPNEDFNSAIKEAQVASSITRAKPDSSLSTAVDTLEKPARPLFRNLVGLGD